MDNEQKLEYYEDQLNKSTCPDDKIKLSALVKKYQQLVDDEKSQL